MMPFFDDDEFFGDLLLMGAASGGGSVVQETATGNPLTFLTDLAKPLKSLLVPFLPVQSGSGDPSPQNIRPIVAWDGVKVWNGGKNLFNKDIEPYKTGMYISEVKNSMVGYTENANYNVYRIPVKSNTYYTFGLIKASTPMYAMLNEQGYVVNSGSNDGGTAGTYKTIITTSATKHLLLSVAVNGTYKCDDVLQLEEGQAHTEYEPITETDISFPSPVYGGTPDVISGRMAVEWATKTFDGSSDEVWYFVQVGSTAFYRAYVNMPDARQPNNMAVFADSYKGVSFDNRSFSSKVCFMGNENETPVIFALITDLTTLESFKAYLAENPLTIAYKLATPQEITLTPEQISALKGTNTIWTDANGSMTAVYLKKG